MEERYFIQDNTLCKFEIEQDEYADSPREMYENVGVMCIWWGNYALGDYEEIRGCDPHDYLEKLIDEHLPEADYEHGELGTMELLKILKTCDDLVYLDLHVFEHGMISVSTSEFLTPWGGWDQGLAGLIWTDKKHYEYLCGESDDWKERSIRILENEVKGYDMYLQGEVYLAGYSEYDIERDEFEETEWIGGNFSDKYDDSLFEELFSYHWSKDIPKFYEDLDEAMEEYRNTLLESGDYDSLLKLA